MAKSKTPMGTTQSGKAPKSVPTKRVGANAKRATTASVGTVTKYLVPGGALLGSALVATTGVLLRTQLERLVRAGLKSAAAGGASARDATADQLNLQTLLAHVGLQRRRNPAIVAAVGAFAGLVAGSALVAWLAPRMRRELASKDAPTVLGKDSGMNHAMPHP